MYYFINIIFLFWEHFMVEVFLKSPLYCACQYHGFLVLTLVSAMGFPMEISFYSVYFSFSRCILKHRNNHRRYSFTYARINSFDTKKVYFDAVKFWKTIFKKNLRLMSNIIFLILNTLKNLNFNISFESLSMQQNCIIRKKIKTYFIFVHLFLYLDLQVFIKLQQI